MWHAYEDIFCGFWLGCVAFVVTTVVYLFFSACLHIVICHPTICAMFVSLPNIIFCFHQCCLFCIMWCWKCTPCFYNSHVFFTQHYRLLLLL
jgi:hypothetical protein